MSRTRVEYSWEAFEARRRAINDAIEADTPRSMAHRDPAAPVPLSVLDDVPYVELHLHSNYSLLDGASSIDELLVSAARQGHRALALTDHEGMYGAMEFARSAKDGVTIREDGREVEVRFRAITGLELTVQEPSGSRHHVTLLAETREGYAHLCRLSSRAFGLYEDDPDRREARRLDPVVPIRSWPVPLVSSTSTWFASKNLPRPRTTLTLRAFAIPAKPPVNFAITDSL